MKIETGNIYVICPKDKWDNTINENCLVYCISRVSSVSWRTMTLHVPSDHGVRAKMWEDAVHNTYPAYFWANKRWWDVHEGRISTYTFSKKGFIASFGMPEYEHRYVGNMQTGLRALSVKTV